ncbi:MAG: methyltransferase domain-containing protein [Pseudomonadota bacterium]
MQKDLRRRLDRAAAHFAEHAFVHEHTRLGLLERLKPMTVAAKLVLDLGTATGSAIKPLERRFPKARVVGVDVSLPMLAAQPRSWLKKPALVQASALALPFADASVDVVYANLLLPFVDDLPQLVGEVSRVLGAEGLFVFASLGPDSFRELRDAWSGIDDAAHVASFPDMHDVGDALVGAGLRDPVLDVDRLKVSYRSLTPLLRDLSGVGARNSLPGRAPGLGGRKNLQALEKCLFAKDLPLVLDLELVYGHAFGGTPRAPRGPVRIEPSAIGRRRR